MFWDGDCGFCQRCAEWVLRHDRSGRFHVVPYQQAPSPPMDDSLRAACQQAVQVLRADGTRVSGGRAVLFVLEQLGYRWVRWLAVPPMIYVVEWGYQWVARHRGWFGGRRRCERRGGDRAH